MSQSKQISTFFHYLSRVVYVGDIAIGGKNPIRIQSMTNTNTMDTTATVQQTIELMEAGCELVRITTPGIREAENLRNIKKTLKQRGIVIPLIADIHFNPKAAEVAASIVEKVRINPGNYFDRNSGKIVWDDTEVKLARERIADRVLPLLKVCEYNGTAIRIGTNYGSLSERVLSTYGNTPLGMVESAMEFVQICKEYNFQNLVLSMKASDVQIMLEANRLLIKRMIEQNLHYPIHLGVTEAGAGEEARIKSAAGIGSLLAIGIGDTIRVSLTEDPVKEIPFAKQLVDLYGRNETAISNTFSDLQLVKIKSDKSLPEITGQGFPVVTSGYSAKSDLDFKDGSLKSTYFENTNSLAFETNKFANSQNDQSVIFKKIYKNIPYSELLIKTSVDFALVFSAQKEGGIWIEADKNSDRIGELSLKILQALGLRYFKAEFIACPSCGRTQFNIMKAFEIVKQRTAHLKGLKIAVMGCVVNGPGEMAGSDYGYVGVGKGKVTLYKRGKAVANNIDETKAIEKLIELIRESGDWSQSK